MLRREGCALESWGWRESGEEEERKKRKEERRKKEKKTHGLNMPETSLTRFRSVFARCQLVQRLVHIGACRTRLAQFDDSFVGRVLEFSCFTEQRCCGGCCRWRLAFCKRCWTGRACQRHANGADLLLTLARSAEQTGGARKRESGEGKRGKKQ